MTSKLIIHAYVFHNKCQVYLSFVPKGLTVALPFFMTHTAHYTCCAIFPQYAKQSIGSMIVLDKHNGNIILPYGLLSWTSSMFCTSTMRSNSLD